MRLLTVNVGRPKPVAYTDAPGGVTGIDKRPVTGPVLISDPGPKGVGASGLAGDAVCDMRHHGGSDQAVYAFAREDLDRWEREIGRPLDNGAFGENFTTCGIDLTHAKVGERWRIGGELVLEITSGRIPCRTFQGRLGEEDWLRRFMRRAETGAYLRVLVPGEARSGDPIEVIHRPAHEVTVQLAFRASTLERRLLPRVLAAGEALHSEELRAAREYVAKYGTGVTVPEQGEEPVAARVTAAPGRAAAPAGSSGSSVQPLAVQPAGPSAPPPVGAPAGPPESLPRASAESSAESATA